MNIVIGADHGGFALKEEIKEIFSKQGYIFTDLGNLVYDANDDYPDFAGAVAAAISEGRAEKGIIVCGSGVGACIAANKFKGVRACVCHDTYSARQGVVHDAMNVLCLGGRVVGIEPVKDIVSGYLQAQFSDELRHARRLAKVLAFEK